MKPGDLVIQTEYKDKPWFNLQMVVFDKYNGTMIEFVPVDPNFRKPSGVSDILYFAKKHVEVLMEV